MLNDRKASELVTKSMRRALTDEEADVLSKNLTDSKELEAFAKLSHKIQISAVEIASLVEQGDLSLGPGLSDEAKDRLRSLIQAVSRYRGVYRGFGIARIRLHTFRVRVQV